MTTEETNLEYYEGVVVFKYTDRLCQGEDTKVVLKITEPHITAQIRAFRRYLAARGYTEQTINQYMGEE